MNRNTLNNTPSLENRVTLKTTSAANLKQRGIALPITLILLFVLTLIGVATLRTSTFEEGMTANSRLRQVAFNAAETALREAEVAVVNLRGSSRRTLFFGNSITPQPGGANPGDTCEGGYCIPAQFSTAAITPGAAMVERWEDTTLDVWNDPTKHLEYTNYADTNLAQEGVNEAPKYIVEFMGNYDLKQRNAQLASKPDIRPEFLGPYRGNCRDPEKDNALKPPNDKWPYCASDPGVFRITVRATAGPDARQAVVLLQSILRVPFNTGGT